jgi:small subunit ribosomal protein S20
MRNLGPPGTGFDASGSSRGFRRIGGPLTYPGRVQRSTHELPGDTVANIKSQIKRNRQNEKRRVRNKSVKSELRTRTKSALAHADDETTVATAMKHIDKAAANGVIHKNAAARRKSRLMKALSRKRG